MVEPEQLYQAHRDAVWLFEDKELPPWRTLTWPERDAWQATVDELNESRRNND